MHNDDMGAETIDWAGPAFADGGDDLDGVTWTALPADAYGLTVRVFSDGSWAAFDDEGNPRRL